MELRAYLDKAGHGASRRMAEALGAYASDVSSWASGRRRPGVAYCVAIEQHTQGAVTRRDLRPDDWQDIWPELADPQPNTAPAPAQQAPAAINSEALHTGQEVAHV